MKNIFLRLLLYYAIYMMGALSPSIALFIHVIGSPQIDNDWVFKYVGPLIPVSALIIGPLFILLYYLLHKKYTFFVNFIMVLLSSFYVGLIISGLSQTENSDYLYSNAAIAGILSSVIFSIGYIICYPILTRSRDAHPR